MPTAKLSIREEAFEHRDRCQAGLIGLLGIPAAPDAPRERAERKALLARIAEATVKLDRSRCAATAATNWSVRCTLERPALEQLSANFRARPPRTEEPFRIAQQPRDAAPATPRVRRPWAPTPIRPQRLGASA